MADDKFSFTQEVERRRTFAIISHPDAGKTTLTEKFLLYGGAIRSAGSVKSRRSQKHAVSDWMEIEKQRGISVTSSVLQFEYDNFCINILDTPGHQDFSEDTYRTLMQQIVPLWLSTLLKVSRIRRRNSSKCVSFVVYLFLRSLTRWTVWVEIHLTYLKILRIS